MRDYPISHHQSLVHPLLNADPASLHLPCLGQAHSTQDDPKDCEWVLRAVPLVTNWFTVPDFIHVGTRNGAHLLNKYVNSLSHLLEKRSPCTV